jgi:hypothetical protein
MVQVTDREFAMNARDLTWVNVGRRAVINHRSLPAQVIYDLIEKYTLLVSETTLKEINED